MPRALDKLTQAVESLNVWVGRAASWLYPVLMVVIIYNVVMRYGFGRGSIMLEELQWHLYSAAFLMGLAYTYAENDHVRVDVVYAHLTPRKQAWIDLFGCIFLLIPFAGLLTWNAWPYFIDSWHFNERSDVPSGLPARYVIKFVLFAGMLLLLLQAVVVALRKLIFLLNGHRPS